MHGSLEALSLVVEQSAAFWYFTPCSLVKILPDLLCEAVLTEGVSVYTCTY
jgi:hypothetical protein